VRLHWPGDCVAPLDPMRFAPNADRPVRAKSRPLAAETRVEPHSHAWAQVAFSGTGVTRVTAGRSTYIVPPSRAVWIPPGIEHAVTVVENADLRTLYLHQPAGRCGPDVPPEQEDAWRRCRVIEVSSLLRELVTQLTLIAPAELPATDATTGSSADTALAAAAAPPDHADRQREQLIVALLLDELRRAQPLPLGVALPQDKRLRSLCLAMLDTPTRHATLDGWAAEAGASPRTVARLFRQELGTSFQQWRQQVMLAKALSLAARRKSMSFIAAELGYASPSAFSAMVTRSVGMAPSRFFGGAAGSGAPG
jgi:AraC-like DNA-binding protein